LRGVVGKMWSGRRSLGIWPKLDMSDWPGWRVLRASPDFSNQEIAGRWSGDSRVFAALLRSSLRQALPQGVKKHFRVDRLGDMAVHAGGQAGCAIVVESAGCQRNDRRGLVG